MSQGQDTQVGEGSEPQGGGESADTAAEAQSNGRGEQMAPTVKAAAMEAEVPGADEKAAVLGGNAVWFFGLSD